MVLVPCCASVCLDVPCFALLCLDVRPSRACCTLLCLVVPRCVSLGSLAKVDVLFMDETFKLAPVGSCAPEDTQFLFVTATLPQVPLTWFTATNILLHCLLRFSGINFWEWEIFNVHGADML